ncbi:MAG: hypothetical protein F6K40_08325 [Okeania sp. SIO3I5]|uniref:DUF6173 family protein n=1 Tax=Okeania sp. SIO3I5 TaxID=2607805 RepID=UPI0013BD6345|nr:DUF6173 family protein [Okeania sp. SIO3I5]NEQ36287.1 hypothetical protein [Okeania sp. SIO3I5]
MSLQPVYPDESALKVAELTKRFTDFYSANCASNLAEQLYSEMQKFDSNLDTEHEVGGKLVSFGESITFHVSGISYRNPSLIIFYGFTENGEPVKLMQNVSQISLLLIRLPKLKPEKPKRKIGFIQNN